MIISAKVLMEFCTSMNTTLMRKTPYGVRAEKSGTGYKLIKRVRDVGRQSEERVVFEGSVKDCYCYIYGLRDALREWYPYNEDTIYPSSIELKWREEDPLAKPEAPKNDPVPVVQGKAPRRKKPVDSV